MTSAAIFILFGSVATNASRNIAGFIDNAHDID